MITLNLTKEEIERLYFIWQRSWTMLDPDEEDTIGAKIQDAFIHRDDDIEPEHRHEVEAGYACEVKDIICRRESEGWEFVSMAMSNDNDYDYILLFRK